MKYNKGTFIIVPNIQLLSGKAPVYQAIFMWLCRYADETGVCFPSREKLSTNVGVDIRTIARHLSQMEQDGIITRTKRRKKGDVKNKSNLYQIIIQEDIFAEQEDKNSTYQEDTDVPVTVSSINSIQRTVVPNESLQESLAVTDDIGKLPDNRGKTRIQRVVSIYRDLFKEKYGIYPLLNMAGVGSSIDKLSERYTEIQIAAMLVSFFNWRGVSGESAFDGQKLVDRAHPFGWFYSTITQYEIYLRNVYGLKFEDENEVRTFVAKSMISLIK